MSENLQPQSRARRPGNPAWVPGVSGNPGGKSKQRMELQAAIEKIHAGPLALDALERLRGIGMGTVKFGMRKSAAEDKVQVAALVAYLDRVGAHVRKPAAGEEDRGLKELSAEEMDELAGELKARAETKRGEVA